MHQIEKKEYRFLCTTYRDQVLKGIPKKYSYYEKSKVYNRIKIVRCLHPVVMSKAFEATGNIKKHKIVLVYFNLPYLATF